MLVVDILPVERVLCSQTASSKKSALEAIAKLLCSTEADLDYETVFNCLLSRERLGSTGLGHGVAIPHGRISNNASTLGAFVQIEQGVDYDSPDNEPVDLIFGLLVPEESTEEHLQILSTLAEMFSNESTRHSLRNANTSEAILKILTD